MTLHQTFIGCDVSKAHLDIFDPQHNTVKRIENNDAAIRAYLTSLSKRSVFVVYESTGTYDRTLRYRLAEQEIASARLNPMMARRFAQATGKRAKTDRLDAVMLSNLGQTLCPAADERPCPEREELTAYHRLRDQLVGARAKERVRLQDALTPEIGHIHESLIAHLTDKIKAVEAKIQKLISLSQPLQQTITLLMSAPGVGLVTATTMVSLLPELGTLRAKPIASLAGLAPYNHDSGQFRGKRFVSGGRKRVRNALYISALVAAHRTDRYKRHYQALIAKGKPKKVALIAIARKLLTHLNAMIIDKKAWA